MLAETSFILVRMILIQIGERMKSVTEYLYLNPLFLTNILYLKPVSILFLNYQIIFRKSKFMLATSINWKKIMVLINLFLKSTL